MGSGKLCRLSCQPDNSEGKVCNGFNTSYRTELIFLSPRKGLQIADLGESGAFKKPDYFRVIGVIYSSVSVFIIIYQSLRDRRS